MRRLAPALLTLSLLAVAASCGDAEVAGTTTSTVAGEVTKPSVSLPEELPTELVVTDLITGTGAAAANGDTLVLHYVGVRSANGEEFDNSYDSASPFEVSLGAGSVIAGWEQGLVGVQSGGRRQLDIPAELAYGDSPQGDIIQPGDALTFVIDVLAVLPVSDAADDPSITVTGGANVAETTIEELIEGDGAELADGQNVAIQIVAYRADTGAQLDSSWGRAPLSFVYSADSDVYPGLLEAVKGMKVGGRRQVQIPYLLMFDGLGNQNLDLPAEVDLTVVIDLILVY